MRMILSILMLMMLVAVATAGDTEITGFVDAAYFHDFNASQGEFGLDQVEIDIIHQASERTMVRADVEWVKDGNDFAAQVEQAFMAYTASCDWTLTFGKFNAPIGFELLDAPDMYQYSHSLVFDYGLPTNLTGVAVSRDLTETLDIIAYGCNGWDANTEDNENFTFGGRLGYAAPYGATAGLSAISGKEGEGEAAFTRTVYDVDLGYQTGQWTFGGEFNLGAVTMADDAEADWTAFLIMAHYDVNDWFGFTARYDTFDDADGYAFGLVGGEAQTRSSITLAPTFVLDDGFGALIELRMDMSDQDAFLDSDGEPTDSSTAVAFEMTYSW